MNSVLSLTTVITDLQSEIFEPRVLFIVISYQYSIVMND